MEDVRLILGDCTTELKALPDASVDCVITDPPYPCIKRSYGTWTETEWFSMMRVVVPECMRILKPTGSAVFILQPNSERVGRMRTWLWEFMLWVGKEWGIVQDAWWLNDKAMPEAHSIQGRLMRPSVKACIWVGAPGCYRNQDAALWEESQSVKLRRIAERSSGRIGKRKNSPSGHGVNTLTKFNAAESRGGVSPLNVFVANHERSQSSAGAHGHGAGTPGKLCDWWLRYLCPPGGIVLDPFSGSGTVALAALKQGKQAIGIERIEEYHRIAEKRIADARAAHPLFDGVV